MMPVGPKILSRKRAGKVYHIWLRFFGILSHERTLGISLCLVSLTYLVSIDKNPWPSRPRFLLFVGWLIPLL